MKCIAWNVKSLVNKVDLVMSVLIDNDTDLAFISETWLSSQSNTTTSIIKSFGYDICHSFREKRGAGVGIIWSNRLSKQVRNVSVLKEFTTFHYQSMLFHGDVKMNLVCIYRLQETSPNIFITELGNLLSNADPCQPLVLTGDFNIHYEKSNTQIVQQLADLTSSYGLMQFVLGPTNNFGHTIDLLFANKHYFDFGEIYPKCNGISDHFPVFFEFPNVTRINSCSKREISYRDIKSVNIQSFASRLGTTLNTAFSDSNVVSTFPELLNSYNNAVLEELNFVAPLQTKTVPTFSSPPWMDAEYRSNRAIRRRLERDWKKSGLPTEKKTYIAQRELCSRMANEKRTVYYSDLIASKSGDQRALFSIVNKLFDKSKSSTVLPQYSDPTELANRFNKFYIHKVQTLRDKIPVNNLRDDQPRNNFDGTILDAFRPTTVQELKEIISVNGIKTSFQDVLPANLLKQVIDELLPYLCLLVNKSLQTGTAEGMKESIIVPLLKKVGLDSEILKNYRPVADLVCISKLTERVVAKRLAEHMIFNNLNCKYEHGYKKHHSPETLLVCLVNDILLALDVNNGVIVLFIDLSAAFDTVDIDLLLHILESEMGVCSTALNWFSSFLKGRKQFVKIEKSLSDALIVDFGVPQGSVLGPVLFNIYIQSLFTLIKESGFSTSGYADDNNAYQGFSIHFQYDVINVQLPLLMSNIKHWMNIHFLKLNSDKTEIITFFPNNVNRNSTINGTFIEGNCIRFSNSVKNLGFILDGCLKMDKQVNSIVSHCYKKLGDVARNRHLLSDEDTVLLMHAIVSSRIDYCNILYYGVNKCIIQKLQMLQNAAARLISKRRKCQSVRDVLKSLHWQRVEERIVFKLLVLTFKILNGMAPESLSNLISVRNRAALLLNNTFLDTSYGRRSFKYAAPRFWNALPLNIRLAASLDNFKQRTKHYLFNNFAILKSTAFMYHQ